MVGYHIEKKMHKICCEIFSGFYRKAIQNFELLQTTCSEIKDFKPYSFPIF